MGTKSNRYQWSMIIAVLLAVLAVQPVWALTPSSGTVLSVMGKAFVKGTPDAEWTPLKKGDELREGSIVKTEAKSLVRFLAPTGSMVKIPAEKEMAVAFDPQKAEAEGGFKTFVAEFLSEKQRTRINAVRSLVDPLQQDWMAFCSFDRIAPDQIETAIELSAAYQDKNVMNRSVFILWKLHDLFPENAGLKALSDHAVSRYNNSGNWNIRGIVKNQETDLQSAAEIAKGDKITASYRTQNESYVYLFMSKQYEDGTVSSVRYFPGAEDMFAVDGTQNTTSRGLGRGKTDDTFFKSRVGAEPVYQAKEDGVSITQEPTPFAKEVVNLKKGQVVQVLEEKGRRYMVRLNDDTKGWVLQHKLESESPETGTKSGDILAEVYVDDKPGTVYIWGWSSLGPLPFRIINQTVTEVEKGIKKADKPFESKSLASLLPNVCRDAVVLPLKHR